MKIEEKIAKQFLEQMMLGDVIFEPDGNIPPDFTFTKTSIGIEVRRLNQLLTVNGVELAEEEISIPLWKLLKTALGSFDQQYAGKTYWIGIEYLSSFLPNRSTQKQIQSALQRFLTAPSPPPCDVSVNDSITLHVFDSKPVLGCVFRLAGSLNDDACGAILNLYVENIHRCIREKSYKIMPHKNKYRTWWLLLVDYMGWGLDEDEAMYIKDSIGCLDDFQSLLVVSYDGRLLLRI